MKKIYAFAYTLLLAGISTTTTYAQTVKFKPLPEIQAQRLVSLAKARKTLDGTSVEEVLKYAQKMRK